MVEAGKALKKAGASKVVLFHFVISIFFLVTLHLNYQSMFVAHAAFDHPEAPLAFCRGGKHEGNYRYISDASDIVIVLILYCFGLTLFVSNQGCSKTSSYPTAIQP